MVWEIVHNRRCISWGYFHLLKLLNEPSLIVGFLLGYPRHIDMVPDLVRMKIVVGIQYPTTKND